MLPCHGILLNSNVWGLVIVIIWDFYMVWNGLLKTLMTGGKSSYMVWCEERHQFKLCHFNFFTTLCRSISRSFDCWGPLGGYQMYIYINELWGRGDSQLGIDKLCLSLAWPTVPQVASLFNFFLDYEIDFVIRAPFMHISYIINVTPIPNLYIINHIWLLNFNRMSIKKTR